MYNHAVTGKPDHFIVIISLIPPHNLDLFERKERLDLLERKEHLDFRAKEKSAIHIQAPKITKITPLSCKTGSFILLLFS